MPRKLKTKFRHSIHTKNPPARVGFYFNSALLTLHSKLKQPRIRVVVYYVSIPNSLKNVGYDLLTAFAPRIVTSFSQPSEISDDAITIL